MLCCKHGVDTARDVPRCCALQGGQCCESHPSVRMVQSIHAVLRNALESAVREEVIPRNVAKLVKVGAPKYKVNRGLTVDQARDVLKAARNERLYALYVLALCLGIAPNVVRDIVGHSDIEVTMTIYAHTSLDDKRSALRKLGDALG